MQYSDTERTSEINQDDHGGKFYEKDWLLSNKCITCKTEKNKIQSNKNIKKITKLNLF